MCEGEGGVRCVREREEELGVWCDVALLPMSTET